MLDYRCYLLDRRGTIRAVEPIASSSDRSALRIARDLLAERSGFVGFELWERLRQVHVKMREHDLAH